MKMETACQKLNLAQLCFLLLSIILFVYSYSSNIKHGVLRVEYVKDKWITFMVLSCLASASEHHFSRDLAEHISRFTTLNYLKSMKLTSGCSCSH